MTARRFAALTLLAVLTAAAPGPTFADDPTFADEPAGAGDASWAVLLLDGARIGYVRGETETLPDPPGGTRSASLTAMSFKRFGQDLELSVDLVTEEAANGDLRSFRTVTANPGAETVVAEGTAENGVLTVVTTVNGAESTRTIDLPPGTKSPAYLDLALERKPPAPGETRTFAAFFPELLKAGMVTVVAEAGPRPVALPTGETRELLPVKVTQDVIPLPSTLYFDGAEMTFSETDFLGKTLATFEVSETEALREVVGEELDIAVNTLIPVTPVPNPHGAARIVYAIAIEGRDAADLFPTTDTQSVEALPDGTARVTVTRLPIPLSATAGAAPDSAGPTRFLQSDDPRVRAHANAAAGSLTDAGAVALACERYVARTLTDKNFSTALASAAEVAETLSGDCTEHAVLLAAMLRAKGIPSRVCVGLVTIEGRGELGGHMWTEAYLSDGDGSDGDGPATWRPLDATLGRGGIGAGHLTLARSDLADDAPRPHRQLPADARSAGADDGDGGADGMKEA